MSKDQFGKSAAKALNEYILTLSAHAGVIPVRGSKGNDRDPRYQAELFRERVGDWLEEQGDYVNSNALTTEALDPAADDVPRMRIICTAETLSRLRVQFPSQIIAAETTHEGVSSRRIIKRPGVPKPD